MDIPGGAICWNSNQCLAILISLMEFHYLVESGAVFTLGKSYLSENHQSYFFIRNDPIRKLIAGSNQSAVICGKCAHISYLLNSVLIDADAGRNDRIIWKKNSMFLHIFDRTSYEKQTHFVHHYIQQLPIFWSIQTP